MASIAVTLPTTTIQRSMEPQSSKSAESPRTEYFHRTRPASAASMSPTEFARRFSAITSTESGRRARVSPAPSHHSEESHRSPDIYRAQSPPLAGQFSDTPATFDRAEADLLMAILGNRSMQRPI